MQLRWQPPQVDALEFAELGYVLMSGRLVKAGRGRDLLDDLRIGQLFLGG